MSKGYAATAVAEFLGISYATLDSWVRTNLFVPSLADSKGRGTRRLYSLADIVILKVVAHLSRQGIHRDLLKFVIERMREHEDLILDMNYEQVLITDGQSVFEIKENIYELADFFLSGAKPAWLIPIGKVKLRVRQAVTSNELTGIEKEQDAKVKVG